MMSTPVELQRANEQLEQVRDELRALRAAIELLANRLTDSVICGRDYDVRPEQVRWIVRDLRALAEGCPTCTWPSRETVGMVCQTCGTDYGADEHTLDDEIAQLGWNDGLPDGGDGS